MIPLAARQRAASSANSGENLLESCLDACKAAKENGTYRLPKLTETIPLYCWKDRILSSLAYTKTTMPTTNDNVYNSDGSIDMGYRIASNSYGSVLYLRTGMGDIQFDRYTSGDTSFTATNYKAIRS